MRTSLYKRTDGVLHYVEARVEGDLLSEYRGIVGESGELCESRLPARADVPQAIADALRAWREQGFSEIGWADHTILMIEHRVGKACTQEDCDKRIMLERRIGALLDRTGLGGTSGGEVWPKAYEVFCLVVDFDIAKRVIVAELQGTEYENAWIYEEDQALHGTAFVPATRKRKT